MRLGVRAMMPYCLLPVLLLSSLHAAPASADCPVTNPRGTVHGTEECPGDYETGGLLVFLQPEIEFRQGGPGFVLRDGSLAWKFGWCRRVKGNLTITGERLDGPAPPLRADFSQPSNEPGFSPSHIIFPTEGCWEITGKLGTTSITFITHVVDHLKRK